MSNVSHTPDGTLIYTTPQGVVYTASGDDANCTESACPVELSIYGYRASLPFSVTVIALYAICMAVQIYFGSRYKTWGYMTSMLLGCICEILGYVGRILLWINPWNHAGFTLQIVLITIAPVFFSAAIYVMIYQIAHYISAQVSRFPPKYFYWIFIPCDIVSLILQAVGGTMSARTDGESNAGLVIALVGLGFQVFTITLFATLAVDYAILSRWVWTTKKLSRRFLVFCAFLAAATILIQVRCCYRIYELSGGYSRNSEALRNQAEFISLEGAMVVTAAWCLVVAHPGPVFYSSKDSRSRKAEELYPSEKPTEEEQPSTQA